MYSGVCILQAVDVDLKLCSGMIGVRRDCRAAGFKDVKVPVRSLI